MLMIFALHKFKHCWLRMPICSLMRKPKHGGIQIGRMMNMVNM